MPKKKAPVGVTRPTGALTRKGAATFYPKRERRPVLEALGLRQLNPAELRAAGFTPGARRYLATKTVTTPAGRKLAKGQTYSRRIEQEAIPYVFDQQAQKNRRTFEAMASKRAIESGGRTRLTLDKFGRSHIETQYSHMLDKFRERHPEFRGIRAAQSSEAWQRTLAGLHTKGKRADGPRARALVELGLREAWWDWPVGQSPKKGRG